MENFNQSSLIPASAFGPTVEEGTLGAEEELWLANPETQKLTGGAQKILAVTPKEHFSGELVDCEIESNSSVHREPTGVSEDLISRRQELLRLSQDMGRVLGVSGTHPIGDWREQEIIDLPHYRRLEELLGWLIRRNNTFALHVHYAVRGKEKAIYLFNRLREYVPHMLALSVNSPFWQGEYTGMQSSRTLIFSRSIHRAGLPEPLSSWEDYLNYVNYLHRSGSIVKLGEIWWDVRLHPVLSTVEIRTFDAQTSPWKTEALIAVAAATCDVLIQEYETGSKRPLRSGREIEENKWSAQRWGLEGSFVDHDTYGSIPTRKALESFIEYLRPAKRDLSGAERILSQPTEADRQLEVWRESRCMKEVVRDIVQRTSNPVKSP